jgi:hypothetical protein
MKEIIIKTQDELDKLPDKFEKYTQIIIQGGNYCNRIIIKVARGNSSVEARGNSSVEAWGNSSVEAWGNSSVVAWGNSSVVARGNSSVVAWENSSVVARGNSSVVARGNSSVEAWENSSVVAWENSSVEAWGNSSVKVFSEYCNIKKALQETVIIYIDTKGKPKKVSKTASVIFKKTAKYTKKDFLEIYENNKADKEHIYLYKSVNPKTNCDFYTGKIKYEGIVKCPDWKSNKEQECGSGLHLSPTPELALRYNQGKILKCKVAIKDFVVYPYNIDKVRCKKIEVIK